MKLFPIQSYKKLQDDLPTPQKIQQTAHETVKSTPSSFSMHSSSTSSNTTADSDSSVESLGEKQFHKHEKKQRQQQQDRILLTSMAKNIEDVEEGKIEDQPKNSSTRTMKEAEKYWHRYVLPKLSPDQREIVTEKLFCRLWTKESDGGSTTGLIQDISTWTSPSISPASSSLPFTAEEHFVHGCELWGEENYTEAMLEFERSLEMREIELQQSLLFVRRQVQTQQGEDVIQDHVGYTDDANDKDDTNEDTEARAQLFYAIGTVHMSLGDHAAALLEFRRSLQISGIGLGIDDHLTQACMYMLKRVLLVMGGHTSPAIKAYIRDVTADIEKEADADRHYKMGNLEDALEAYANLSFVKDEDPQIRGRVQTKMALIFEEKGDFLNAQEVWSDVMSLYALSPSIGSTHPMTIRAMSKYVQSRVKMQEQF